jgi:hypothetical protein
MWEGPVRRDIPAWNRPVFLRRRNSIDVLTLLGRFRKPNTQITSSDVSTHLRPGPEKPVGLNLRWKAA